MIRTLLDSSLPAPVQQFGVRIGPRSYRLDGAYPPYLVCIEYEGFDFHTSLTAFDNRYERDRDLRFARWMIVYVTRRTSGPPSPPEQVTLHRTESGQPSLAR